MPITNLRYAEHHDDGSTTQTPRVLVQRGPFLPVEISLFDEVIKKLQDQEAEIPAPAAGYALIDTGATASAIDQSVVDKLTLQPVGTANIGTAGGQRETQLYNAQLSFPGTGIRDIRIGRLLGVDLEGQALGQVQHTGSTPQEGKLIALVGRDVLARFVMIYNGPEGAITLAY